MSVKVAVRVRPFNKTEQDLNTKRCIDMVNNTTIITNNLGKAKDFTFDYSFWSHDEFEENENGYFVPLSDRYSDQQKVFDTVGKEILDNAWQGYHCCLFAYGQTGSGKSYSMVGYGANKGIVPIACQDIFNRIENNIEKNKEYEVQISMLEIYNEKVQDLLIGINLRPQGGLKVREHKLYGVYVENLTKYAVDSYEAIQNKMEEGNRNRSIGSTQMNQSSSRAHTVITIEFKIKETMDGKKMEKLSIINLVDLAGSEKLSKTEAKGDRMKEGCAINKSLTVLGLVISSLADKAMGKDKNKVVPYRDSALTRILQNALGGNSKTLMICALSPSDYNYEETLSTLRYADQAKKIKCNAVVNESEQDKMIRELKIENEKLKQQLMMGGGGEISVNHLERQRLKEMEDELKQNQKMLSEYQISFQEKLKQQLVFPSKVDFSKPFLVNLNEDPYLNAKVKYSLAEETIIVGKKNGNPQPNIILGGLEIQPNHAIFTYSNSNVYLQPYRDECAENIFINGQFCTNKVLLHDNDRIIFGNNSIFIVKIPKENEKIDSEFIPITDWEEAQQEVMKKLNEIRKQQEQETIQQQIDFNLKQLENKYVEEKLKQEEQLKIQQAEYEQKIKQLEQQMNSDEHQYQYQQDQIIQIQKLKEEQVAKLQEEKSKILAAQENERFKRKERQFLESKLAKYMPKVQEVNLIAKELKKNVSFNIKLVHDVNNTNNINSNNNSNNNNNNDQSNENLKIKIEGVNKDYGYIYQWDTKKFNNRYFIMKDLLENYFENQIVPQLSQENDPFWDPPDFQLIGQAFLNLLSLPYLIDNPSTLKIIAEEKVCGQVSVNILPVDQNGNNLVQIMEEEARVIEEPEEILENAQINDDFWQNIYCEYQLIEDCKLKSYKTQSIAGNNNNPVFNYEKQHSIPNVTQQILNYLLEETITINIYGHAIIPIVQQQQISKQNSMQKQQIKKDSDEIDLNSFQTNYQYEANQSQKIMQQKSKDQIKDTIKKTQNQDCILF